MSRTLKIAVVDDEPDMRESISQWLALSGFDTETFASADDALKVIGADWPGGFLCPCHGSTFDFAGRVFKNKPAPTNLEIPPHQYLTDTRLIIGSDETGST